MTVVDLTERSVVMSFLIETPLSSWRYRLSASAVKPMVR
jgi:hypothetical protein